MKEHQHIEWKETWRDEYLKSICGFANAEGGVLVIGRNDRGEALGLKDAPKLLADLPNKVRDVLGILVDVNLRDDRSLGPGHRTDHRSLPGGGYT
jgi:ATP-dependent DNA helicase RecG